MMLKNPRHEKFCQEYVRNGGNGAAAIRVAYPNRAKWADKAVWNKSSELLKRGDVQVRVEEIRKEVEDAEFDFTKAILGIYKDVLEDKEVTDYIEEADGRKKRRSMSKTEAIKGIRAMLGLDQAQRMEVTSKSADTRTREEKIADILRLQQSRQ